MGAYRLTDRVFLIGRRDLRQLQSVWMEKYLLGEDQIYGWQKYFLYAVDGNPI